MMRTLHLSKGHSGRGSTRPWRQLRAFLVLVLLSAFISPGSAQINYFQGWEAGAGGWTTSQGGVSNNTPCAGLNSMRWNVGIFTAGTMQLNSPQIGISSGLQASYSFIFRRDNSSNFGGMRSYWATSAGGPWTQTTHSVSNQNCNTYTVNFNPPAGQPIFLRLEAQKTTGCCSGSRTYWFDNVTVTQAGLECPAATFSLIENCGAGTYQLSANVSTAGPSAQLQYSVDGVPQTPVPVTGAGTFNTPAISVASAVTYTLTNTQVTQGFCPALTGYRYSTCPITLDCSQVLTLNHCYRNGDDRTWHFVNPSSGTVDIQFLSPSPIVDGDGINFYNGAPGVNQISVPGYGNDLSNFVVFTSPGSVFSFEVETDGAGSCEDGVANAPWTFEVKCTPNCLPPVGDINVQVSDCNTNTFMIELDLYDLGETNGNYNSSAGIRYSVDGGAPTDVLNLDENLHYIGPFPTTSQVAVTLLHENDLLCNSFVGTFGRLTPCPPLNDLCAAAATLPVNAPGACPGAAVTGTTFDANNEISNPSCSLTGQIQDVWYSFNSGYSNSPLTITITPGTIEHWGVQVFSGSCGGTSVICNNSSPTSVSVPSLAIFTNYWVRVYTNADLGAPGSFGICLSAAPIASACGTTVYDTGGPGGNYGNSQNYAVTYCSSTFGDLVTATFTTFNTEATWDRLYIHNGPSISDPIFSSGNAAGNGGGNPGPGGFWGNLTGAALPGPFTSSHPTGCLTFRFWSDGSVNFPGWAANLTCCTAPAAEVTAGVTEPLICQGGTVALTATSPTATVFNWTGPNSFTSPAQNPSIPGATVAASGTYTVIARNGPNGCASAPSTVSVEVKAPPTGVNASANNPFACAGDAVNLSAEGTGVPPVILSSNFNTGAQGWTTSNSSSGGTPANAAWTLRPSPFTQNATFSSNDASQFYLSNSDAQGSGSTTDAYLTSPSFSTVGYTTASLSFWHFYQHLNNGAAVQISTNNGATWTPIQSYTATQGSSQGFVQATINLNAYVNQGSLRVRFRHLATWGWYWAIDNVTISGTPEPFTYAWSSTPSGFNSTDQNPNGVVLTETTTYNVVASSAPGCSASGSVTVQVGVPLQASVTGPGSFTYCAGTSSVNLSGSATGGGGPYTYEWIDAGNNVVATGTSLVNYTPAESTTISLRVTDNCGELTTVGTRPVTVNQLPPVAVTPNVVSNCGGGTSTLVASGALTYSWTPAAGLNTTTGATVIANPSAFITTYTVTGTDGNGCINAATAQVTVSSVPAAGATTSYSTCVNSTIPVNQGLTSTCPPFQATEAYAFPGSNFPTNQSVCGAAGTAFNTVSTVSLPALPLGAVPVAARIVLNDVVANPGSQLSHIRVATTGVITLAETQISAVNASGSIAQYVITIPAAQYPIGGGLVNLRLRETVNDGLLVIFVCIQDNLDDGRVGSASVEVDYAFPTTKRWYDAPVGGNQVATGEVFNPFQGSVVNNAVDGFYTFYAACEANGCESPRVPAYFSVGSQNATLEIYTDNAPADLSWQFQDVASGVVLYNGQGFILPPESTFPLNYCFPADRCYKFRMTDSGAGTTGNPGYQLRSTATQARLIDNKDNFNFNGTSEISGNAYSFCMPNGPDELIYTSCDKYWWRTGEFIVANENPAVSALWIAGGANGVQPANTGYEFWFFNPNGGYSFRKFRSHNLADGFGNVGATRACHLKVNNWAAANHIPEFNLHNVRVRSRVNGANSGWGTACRFTRDQNLSLCPPTKLMDIPGNQFLSCNQFRQFVSNQRVHARPVTGATQYQWRFRIEDENVEIIRTSTSYFLNLGWSASVAPPLENAKTYTVDVRAFRNGVWCVAPLDPESAWGDVCNLTIGVQPQMTDGNTQNFTEAGNGLLGLWPNPNNGTEVWINLTEIDDRIETVTVDIHDLFGKRVSASTLATQDGMVYTVMPLNGDLAAGMYMVTITAGDAQYVQRLLIQP